MAIYERVESLTYQLNITKNNSNNQLGKQLWFSFSTERFSFCLYCL